MTTIQQPFVFTVSVWDGRLGRFLGSLEFAKFEKEVNKLRSEVAQLDAATPAGAAGLWAVDRHGPDARVFESVAIPGRFRVRVGRKCVAILVVEPA